MRVLSEHRDTLPVKYVQIDEGWNTGWGPWETNRRLGDMKALADEIRDSGFIPSIWVAPFGCYIRMPLAKEHPEWFVKNADGEPWEGETLFVATASPLADAHHADASVFLEKDGYTAYRVVPAREEYTLTLKS